MSAPDGTLDSLNERSRDVFRELVETYLATGAPVGSRTLSQRLPMNLSAASIRNVMSDLEDLGLLHAPHTSAGRLPTDIGLRLFVDGLLQVGNLSSAEQDDIAARCVAAGKEFEAVLDQASGLLSGLSTGAGLVFAPSDDAPIKHIEFVALSPGKALAVLVTEEGRVENRVMEVPIGLPPSALQQAGNYLCARLGGKTLAGVRAEIEAELAARQAELDALTSDVVEQGLALWADGADRQTLIVRGQANLLEDLKAAEDLERARKLLEDLENKKDFIHLLDAAREGEGVRMFIGSETNLFSLSGSSVIVAPFTNAREQIVGVIGVIGPTHMNYARVIPMVDYTARVVGKLL